MKTIFSLTLRIGLLAFGFASWYGLPTASAFGECSQYGVFARYDSLRDTCKCMYGYAFVDGILGPTCKSYESICDDQLGIMSTYNSLYDTCECLTGYIIDVDLLGNKSCQSANSVCWKDLGTHSSYDSLTKKCTCNYGYTIRNGKCVGLDDQCHDQLGIMSSYNALDDTCKCDPGYIIDGDECKNADLVCSSRHGLYSSYNSLKNKCECDDDYTFDEYGKCVKTQHNVYFTVIELDDDNSEVVIRSDYDRSYYHVSYGLGCLSFWKYENRQIVVNLGTDYSLDTWDKIVLQEDDQNCNIVTKDKVDSLFTLNEEEESDGYYPPLSGDVFESDIASSPYNLAIATLKQKGIIGGYPDGTYKPRNPINRAEFMKIVMGAVGTPASGGNCYPDVKDEWFAAYACAAKQQEIATGYPDGTFRPTNDINVVEALKIVLKAFVIPVRGVDEGEEWYEPYIEVARLNELYVPSFDSPDKKISREEMAELVNRILNLQSRLAQ